METSAVAGLPESVLLRVFRLLTVEELLSCSLVCHAWNECASDSTLWAWKYFSKRPFDLLDCTFDFRAAVLSWYWKDTRDAQREQQLAVELQQWQTLICNGVVRANLRFSRQCGMQIHACVVGRKGVGKSHTVMQMRHCARLMKSPNAQLDRFRNMIRTTVPDVIPTCELDVTSREQLAVRIILHDSAAGNACSSSSRYPLTLRADEIAATARVDVVLLLFSLAEEEPLKRISSFWLPLLREHFPSTPLLLGANWVCLIILSLWKPVSLCWFSSIVSRTQHGTGHVPSRSFANARSLV